MPQLTATAVEALLKDCLFRDGEDQSDPAFVEGVTAKFGFHRERLAAHQDDIKALLAELPDEFRADKGGGWSFLNACVDRAGRQWGEQVDMQNLFCLGIAAGLARWLLPRDMWPELPGGMPYVAVTV